LAEGRIDPVKNTSICYSFQKLTVCQIIKMIQLLSILKHTRAQTSKFQRTIQTLIAVDFRIN